MTRKLLLTLLTASLAATAAEDDNNRWHINPTLGFQHFDNNKNLDDGGLSGLGLEYRHNKLWGTALNYLQGSVDGDTGSADVQHLTLEGMYFVKSNNRKFSPYLAVGLGRSVYDYDVIGKNAKTAIVSGPGFHYALDDRWSSKVDTRWIHDLDGNQNDSWITFAVSYAFGETKKPIPVIGDTDKDGVNNKLDLCPNTPVGAAVNANGCEFDSDADGVVNSIDQCPYTYLGARVYTDGCAAKLTHTETIALNVIFASNSDQLTSNFIPELEKVAQFMREYVTVTGVIEGHTDSRGSAALNQQLSQRRAETVRRILLDQFNVDSQRLSAIGYGEEKPVASNDTIEGRQQNRRVEAVFKAQVTE